MDNWVPQKGNFLDVFILCGGSLKYNYGAALAVARRPTDDEMYQLHRMMLSLQLLGDTKTISKAGHGRMISHCTTTIEIAISIKVASAMLLAVSICSAADQSQKAS